MRYKCSNCNYILEVPEGKKLPVRCPYCAKENTLQRVKTAQEFIDEVSSLGEES